MISNNTNILSPSSHILRRMASLPPPVQLLNILNRPTQVVIIILFFSQTIFMNQQSWCLQLTKYSTNASPIVIDPITNAQNASATYNHNVQQPFNSKQVSNEQYHRPSQVQVSTGGKSASSQTNQVNVRPPVRTQQSISGPSTTRNHLSQNHEYNETQRHHNRDLDNLNEGSGDGPISVGSSRRQQVDDTEEGDDDEDEEDYDYKDSPENGSGHGNQPPMTSRTPDPLLIQSNNQLKKPNSNTDEAYLPFRPATSIKPSTTAPPTKPPTTTTTTTLEPYNWESSTSVVTNNSKFEQIRPQEPVRSSIAANDNIVIEDGRIPSKATLPPFTLGHHPSVIPDNQLRVPIVQVSTPSPISITKYKYNNGSTLLPSRNSSKLSDIDYDYEDENDEEESDDVSNFEYNEAPQTDLPNVTITQSVPYITQHPTKPITISQTTTTTSTTAAPKMTTLLPFSSSTNKPTVNQLNVAQTVPIYSTHSSVTIPPPTMISPSSESSLDYSDEDEDDEDSEAEEEFDDGEDDDLGGPVHGVSTRPTSTSKPTDSPSTTPSRTQPPPTQVPNYLDFENEQYKPVKSISTTLSTQHIKATTQLPNPKVLSTSRATTIAIFPTTTTTTTSSTTTTVSITTTSTTTPAPLQTSIKPTLAPYYTSTSTRPASIRYATTPRTRITTPAISYSNIIPYDKTTQDGDVELTRQIYDKAVEVYQATNKAIHAAVEAVWPPSFEVKSGTFEPLVTQPFLFMFVLGAAVIGLVLTLMLVVYIISYQIQPKDDVSIYSHS